MFSADPPLIYWQPSSVGILQLCSELRDEGIQAWETMDAGPQVKIFTIERDVPQIISALHEQYPQCSTIVDKVGHDPVVQDQ